MPRYNSADIIEYAVILRRSMPEASHYDFCVAMRVKFPDITDYRLREAFADAKLLLAIKQVIKDFTGD